MANIKEWLMDAVEELGQPIEAITVGQHYGRDSKYSAEDKPLMDECVVLSVEKALAKLNVEFEDGFGGADCFPLYAWTKDYVLFIHEYDGATSLRCIPRNPRDVAPDFDGMDYEDVTGGNK